MAKFSPIVIALAEVAGCEPSSITKDSANMYSTADGKEFYVFRSRESAYKYCKEWYGPDYCDGATEPSTWFNMISNYADGDQKIIKKCFPNGKDGEPNYKAIAKCVLDSEGPEYFLASYDGEEIVLDYKSYVAYRYN